jgi:hypothetical protein
MSTEHDQPFHNTTSQAERRAVLQQDRSAGTYLGHARSNAELGGRFAHLGRETTVVGARPLELDTSQDGHSALALQAERGRIPVYPPQPNHPFAADVGNIEAPFPVDISAVKDMTKVTP